MTATSTGPVSSPEGDPDSAPLHAAPAEMRRILLSSFLGTAVEYYDFILYATAAAIVFNKVFFAGTSPAVGTALSFATLAAGYVARPLGGVVFGHLGDRLGRKSVLIGTVLTIGTASTLIGLVPSTAQIGVLAPVLLVFLRLLQGIAVGGEWGGAMLLGFENAKREARGFAAAFAYLGAPAGTIVGTVVLSVMTTLPSDQFLAWGWRVPFLLSAVFMLFVIYIRLQVSESQVFQRVASAPARRRIPAARLLADHRRSLLIALGAGLSGQMAQGLMGAWAISYAVVQAVLSPTEVLNIKALGGVSTIVVIVIAARLSDRLGRRRVLLAGNVVAVVLAFPVMALLGSGSAAAFALAIFLGLSVVQGFTAGPYGAFAAELFPTDVRYSGTSIGYQLASTLGAGLTPLIATALVVAAGGGLWLVALLWIVFTLVSLVSTLLSPDRSGLELEQLER